MRTALIAGGALLALAAAFLLLPKVALRLSGANTAPTAPANRSASVAGATPAASAQPAFESFADLRSKAGFAPLDPGVLPQGYVPDAQFVAAGPHPTIIFAYHNAAGRSLVITETASPSVQPGSDSPRNRTGAFSPRGTPPIGAPQPVQVAPGVSGRYTADDRRLLACRPDDPATPFTCLDGQPHDVRFSLRGIDVLVAADERDIPRDDLLQIAAGLR